MADKICDAWSNRMRMISTLSIAVIIFFTYAVCAHAQPNRSICALSHLELCPNSNALFSDKMFIKKISRFLTGKRTPYFERATVADQALEALGGLADPPYHYGQFWRFTACRPHSCPEKAAVVLRSDGQIVAVALLHSACVPPTLDCTTDETLTIYASNDRGREVVIKDVSDWAKENVAHAGIPEGVTRPALRKIETIAVEPRR